MEFWKNVVGGLLDPRARLDKLYPRSKAGEAEQGEAQAPAGTPPAGARGRLRSRHVLTNFPLMLGAIIVAGLFLLALLGPAWSPKNPYIAGQHIVPHFDFERQEYVRPP
jgi:hypothetical protein